MAGEAPPLLRLPLELRELIYKEVMFQPSQGPQLLHVCREMYSEAQKFFFQRAIVFHSPSALHQWLQHVPQGTLEHYSEIDIGVQDVDLTQLLVPTAQPGPNPNIHTWDMYGGELERLDRNLRRLPNIKILTLRVSPGLQNHLYYNFIERVLEMLGQVYPGLQGLTLEGDLHRQRLHFLRTFKGLKSFSFEGFSASDATETAEILSSIQPTELSLVSQNALFTPAQPEFLLMHTLERQALEALEEFLGRSSSIQRLELDWPNLHPDIFTQFSLLPDSLKNLSVRATSMESAFDILYNLVEKKEAGAAPSLKQVVLVRSPWDSAMIDERQGNTPVAIRLDHAVEENVEPVTHNDETINDDPDKEKVDLVKRRLNALGVTVAWRTDAA